MQKNNNILGISFIIVSVLLAVSIFLGLWNYGRSDKKYRDLLAEHYGTIEEVGELATKLNNVNSEFESYKLETDRTISELNGTIDRSREIISALQNVGNTIEGTNQEIEKSVEGIREILKEVLARNN